MANPRDLGSAAPSESRPEWFNYIRVNRRSILGTSHQDYVISFGPRNICKPEMDERRAERLCENIKEWLWMWMQKK